MPVPLDEFPVHQVPMSMEHVASTDRNAYDRSYFNIGGRTDEVFMATGLGVYPNLGVIDAYASARVGDRIHTVRFSDALGPDRMQQQVGGYRIEVIEPLHRVRVVCDPPAGDDTGAPRFDLTWESSFPAVEEPTHQLRVGPKLILDACRFAQVGTWEGHLEVGGRSWEVGRERWLGTRDRSWGIRPVGEAEPPGRTAAETPPDYGFYWVYVPLRFEEFAVVVIVQEDGRGHRTMNDAVRVGADGAVELLGWPRIEIDRRSGTRDVIGARVHLTEPDGMPVTIEVEPQLGLALSLGAGYGPDQVWTHGSWRGRDWALADVVDLDDEATAAMLPFSIVDHHARAVWRGGSHDGAEGWGMFEHHSVGAHLPSGFTDFASVAP